MHDDIKHVIHMAGTRRWEDISMGEAYDEENTKASRLPLGRIFAKVSQKYKFIVSAGRKIDLPTARQDANRSRVQKLYLPDMSRMYLFFF